MNKIVFTVIGRDKPGIVSKVAKILFHLGANIEDSSMTILEGQFAMIFIASFKGKIDIVRINDSLNMLKKSFGLTAHYKKIFKEPELSREKVSIARSYLISVIGSDKPGIIYRISDYLARKKINITDVNTKLLERRKNKNIYTMILEVDIGEEDLFASLKRDLKHLSRDMQVEITVKSLDPMIF